LVVRLRLADRHLGWLVLDCTCGHRDYIKLADDADWRLRQLRAATDPTRLGRAFTVTTATVA
jgi:hypothetical protein